MKYMIVIWWWDRAFSLVYRGWFMDSIPKLKLKLKNSPPAPPPNSTPHTRHLTLPPDPPLWTLFPWRELSAGPRLGSDGSPGSFPCVMALAAVRWGRKIRYPRFQQRHQQHRADTSNFHPSFQLQDIVNGHFQQWLIHTDKSASTTMLSSKPFHYLSPYFSAIPQGLKHWSTWRSGLNVPSGMARRLFFLYLQMPWYLLRYVHVYGWPSSQVRPEM